MQTVWERLNRDEDDELAVLALLESAPVSARDQEGRTLLHLAARLGYVDVSRRLLQRGASAKARDNLGRTPLHYAQGGDRIAGYWVTYGKREPRVALVRLLLTAGAPVGSKDRDGTTALEWALAYDRPDLMRLLIDAGADPNQRDPAGDPLLGQVLGDRGRERLRTLIAGGADPFLLQPNAFARLSAHGNTMLLDELLELWEKRRGIPTVQEKRPLPPWPLSSAAKEKPPTTPDEKLRAALAWSAYPTGDMIGICPAPRLDEVDRLLAAGANPNTADRDGTTVLILAYKNGHHQAGRFLLSRGASLARTDRHGWSALTWLLWVERYVTEFAPSPEARWLRTQNPPLTLWDALLSGDDRLAERLTATHPVHVRANDGTTPIHLAALRGNLAVVRCLLDRGASARAKDAWGITPLHYAQGGTDIPSLHGYNKFTRIGEQRDRPALVLALLKAGAPVRARALEGRLFFPVPGEPRDPNDGTTPLDWAMAFERLDLMRLLVRAGADPNQRDGLGQPILMEQVLRGHTASVQALLEVGADPFARESYGHNDSVLAAAASLPDKTMLRLILQAIERRK